MASPEISIRYVEDDEEFALVYRIRAAVFQQEHALDEETEIDGNEHISHHYLAFSDGLPVGTARWRMTMNGKAKLERFAVLPAYRNQGIGRALAEAILRQVPAHRPVYLEALVNVAGFYEKLGFVPVGEPYEEAGLPHIKMQRA
jgi:predicted GNAT family N-acyltransferase